MDSITKGDLIEDIKTLIDDAYYIADCFTEEDESFTHHSYSDSDETDYHH